MKTTAILTRILPTIAAVRGSGAFNVVIAGQAPKLQEELRQAANDDRIVINPLLATLGRLGAAREFEAQQEAMIDVIELADRLLGDIAQGNLQYAEATRSTVAELLGRLRRNAGSLVDVFRPQAEVLASIQSDASELGSLIDAEVREGTREQDHSLIAARLYDAASRIADGRYDARQRDLLAITRYVTEMAA